MTNSENQEPIGTMREWEKDMREEGMTEPKSYKCPDHGIWETVDNTKCPCCSYRVTEDRAVGEKKVFCCCCNIYFERSKRTPYPSNNEQSCHAPENEILEKSGEDNWFRPAGVRILGYKVHPSDRNKNNDCSWFKPDINYHA